MRTWVTAPITLWLALVTGARATGECVVDQEFDPRGITVVSFIKFDMDKAQTFTVGLSGQLAEVEVFIARDFLPQGVDLVFDVRETHDGVPIEDDSHSLAQVVIPDTDVPTSWDFFQIDLMPFNVLVEARDVLAIVLREQGGNPDTEFWWFGKQVDLYAAGGPFFRWPTEGYNTWTPLTSPVFDHGFKTTVCPIVVAIEAESWSHQGSVSVMLRSVR